MTIQITIATQTRIYSPSLALEAKSIDASGKHRVRRFLARPALSAGGLRHVSSGTESSAGSLLAAGGARSSLCSPRGARPRARVQSPCPWDLFPLPLTRNLSSEGSPGVREKSPPHK